jgi:hypothetical protein
MSIEYVKACQQPTPDVCCITGDGFKFNMEITTPGKETPEEKAKCKEFEGITPLRACIKEKLKNGQFIKGQPNVLAIGIQNHPNWGCLSDLCNSMHEALFGHGKGILLNGKAKQIGTILCFDTQVRHNHKDKFVYAVNVFRMPSPEISIPPEVFKGLKQYQYDENGERTKLGICGKEEFVFD